MHRCATLPSRYSTNPGGDTFALDRSQIRVEAPTRQHHRSLRTVRQRDSEHVELGCVALESLCRTRHRGGCFGILKSKHNFGDAQILAAQFHQSYWTHPCSHDNCHPFYCPSCPWSDGSYTRRPFLVKLSDSVLHVQTMA